MKKEFKEALEDSPIIAAIKDEEGLKKCLLSDSRIIFILYGDICTIADIVNTVKSSGKLAMVHIDLISGLSSKDIVVDFIKKYTKADGIISTKPSLIKHARELGFPTILRLFMLDSMAYENITSQIKAGFLPFPSSQAVWFPTKKMLWLYWMPELSVFLPPTSRSGFYKIYL